MSIDETPKETKKFLSVNRGGMNEAEREDRRNKAIQLRIAGATFLDIGKAMGISRQRAQAIVQTELAQMASTRSDSREALRTLTGERYSAILKRLWMDSGMVRRQNGNADLRLDVVDRVMRVMDSMVKLHGIEAITQAEEESLVLRNSGSRLAMLMMRFVPEEQREQMMTELEKVLSAREQAPAKEDEDEFIEQEMDSAADADSLGDAEDA